jgi:hypothetical protein
MGSEKEIINLNEDELENLEKGMLFVSVKDTGTGIPDKEVSRIFSEFCTLKFNAHLNPNGVGLGLSICKKICNLLEGDIILETKVGVGSTFTFNVTADLYPGTRTGVEKKLDTSEYSQPNSHSKSDDVENEMISDFSMVANRMHMVFQQFKPRDVHDSVELG